jgi:hypothetical protein
LKVSSAKLSHLSDIGWAFSAICILGASFGSADSYH